MIPDRYFYTSQFPLAAYLCAKGHQIAAINSTDDPGRKEFSFIRTDELQRKVDLYKFGNRGDPDLLVAVHAYEQARRSLLDQLNDN